MDNSQNVNIKVNQPAGSTTAWLLGEDDVKRLWPLPFNGCSCHVAFPDQLHTYVGDCSSDEQVVAMVPRGDVRFTSNQLDGMNIIVVTGEKVSADFLELLEDMQISYIFAGADGTDEAAMMRRLHHDFGIDSLRQYAGRLEGQAC